MTPLEDKWLRDSVPAQYKGATSPIGAVQNYIAALEGMLQEIADHMQTSPDEHERRITARIDQLLHGGGE